MISICPFGGVLMYWENVFRQNTVHVENCNSIAIGEVKGRQKQVDRQCGYFYFSNLTLNTIFYLVFAWWSLTLCNRKRIQWVFFNYFLLLFLNKICPPEKSGNLETKFWVPLEFFF